MTEAEQFIRLDVEDRVANIILDRPEKLNAWSWESARQISARADEIRFDDSIRVVIVKGAGRAFSAGYDLTPKPVPDFGGADGNLHHLLYDLKRSGLRWLRAIWDFRKPVIAQVHGYCMAGANDLAGVCDLTVAAEGAHPDALIEWWYGNFHLHPL